MVRLVGASVSSQLQRDNKGVNGSESGPNANTIKTEGKSSNPWARQATW